MSIGLTALLLINPRFRSPESASICFFSTLIRAVQSVLVD